MSAVGTGGAPAWGLVCITRGDRVRFRTITRTRYLRLAEDERAAALGELYRHNLRVLFGALDFCAERELRLYRMSANLFPLADLGDGVGAAVLSDLTPDLARFGPRAEEIGVRVVIHPEQFVVLNSERPEVVENSLGIVEHHGRVLDLLGLPRSSWTAMNVHGGKSGRPDELIAAIDRLSESARARLTLENDERAYGAEEVLAICERAGVPMVFDAHHHVVKEGLTGLEDPSVADFTRRARATWDPPAWQLVHLSNGRTGPADPRHSDLIATAPRAYADVEWVEVEAKAKEEAIAGLRERAFAWVEA